MASKKTGVIFLLLRFYLPQRQLSKLELKYSQGSFHQITMTMQELSTYFPKNAFQMTDLLSLFHFILYLKLDIFLKLLLKAL